MADNQGMTPIERQINMSIRGISEADRLAGLTPTVKQDFQVLYLDGTKKVVAATHVDRVINACKTLVDEGDENIHAIADPFGKILWFRR